MTARTLVARLHWVLHAAGCSRPYELSGRQCSTAGLVVYVRSTFNGHMRHVSVSYEDTEAYSCAHVHSKILFGTCSTFLQMRLQLRVLIKLRHVHVYFSMIGRGVRFASSEYCKYSGDDCSPTRAHHMYFSRNMCMRGRSFHPLILAR